MATNDLRQGLLVSRDNREGKVLTPNGPRGIVESQMVDVEWSDDRTIGTVHRSELAVVLGRGRGVFTNLESPDGWNAQIRDANERLEKVIARIDIKIARQAIETAEGLGLRIPEPVKDALREANRLASYIEYVPWTAIKPELSGPMTTLAKVVRILFGILVGK